MREMKFQFWHKTLHKMSRPYGLGLVWEHLCEEWGVFNWADVEMREYTGLHDNNGAEIYEGDIIRPRNHTGPWIGVVVYRPGGFWILEVAGEESGEETTWSPSIKCEVIGNIYENAMQLEATNG